MELEAGGSTSGSRVGSPSLRPIPARRRSKGEQCDSFYPPPRFPSFHPSIACACGPFISSSGRPIIVWFLENMQTIVVNSRRHFADWNNAGGTLILPIFIWTSGAKRREFDDDDSMILNETMFVSGICSQLWREYEACSRGYVSSECTMAGESLCIVSIKICHRNFYAWTGIRWTWIEAVYFGGELKICRYADVGIYR